MMDQFHGTIKICFSQNRPPLPNFGIKTKGGVKIINLITSGTRSPPEPMLYLFLSTLRLFIS